MKIKIYTLASDTDNGTVAEVFTSERAQLERLVSLHNLEEEEALTASGFIKAYFEGAEDLYEELTTLLENNRGVFDTYNCDSEIIETDVCEKVD